MKDWMNAFNQITNESVQMLPHSFIHSFILNKCLLKPYYVPTLAVISESLKT